MTTAADLVPYPTTRNEAVQGIEARVQRAPGGTLTLHYVLKGSTNLIRVPAAVPAATRADGLWRHTCFEAFVAIAGTAGYYELNFSPSRQWAIYRFSAYREGMAPVEVASAPHLAVRQLDDRLELTASVALPQLDVASPLQLALSAVVEDGGGTLSYWALRHAPAKPDFHHPDSFVIELPS